MNSVHSWGDLFISAQPLHSRAPDEGDTEGKEEGASWSALCRGYFGLHSSWWAMVGSISKWQQCLGWQLGAVPALGSGPRPRNAKTSQSHFHPLSCVEPPGRHKTKPGTDVLADLDQPELPRSKLLETSLLYEFAELAQCVSETALFLRSEW